MHVGVTGTREGMDADQYQDLHAFLVDLTLEVKNLTLHHGDCVGVDEEVAQMCQDLGWRIICHPPASDYKRAYFPSDEVREKFEYLVRDRHIVDETEFLIVVPLTSKPQPKSGTWYTHNYAVKRKKPVEIFYPCIKD